MKHVKILAFCFLSLFLIPDAQAQLLKKIKGKAENAVDKAVDKAVEKKVDNTVDNNTNNNSGDQNQSQGKNKPSNKQGGGLITTPPNVQENLSSAETSFKSNRLGEARFAIQQAIVGVEMELGKQVLKFLPLNIGTLKADTTADKVTSTGWSMGWAGLTIRREYNAGEQQLSFVIANNSPWLQAVNMYLSNGSFAQTSGEQQNWKQTKIKGYRAVIEYNQSSGYKLSVPIGQTSLFMYEGINFATEADFMKAAEQIDLDGVKKLLGEQ